MGKLLGLVTGRTGKYDHISTMALPLPMVLSGGSGLSRMGAIVCFLFFVTVGLVLVVSLMVFGGGYAALFNGAITLAIPAIFGIFFFRLSRSGAAALSLDQDGFTMRYPSRERRVRWDSIEYFKVVRPNRLGAKHSPLLVGWRYKAGFQPQYSSRVRRHTKKFVDDYLKLNYGEYPGDLEQLLNGLRDRHDSYAKSF